MSFSVHASNGGDRIPGSSLREMRKKLKIGVKLLRMRNIVNLYEINAYILGVN